MLLKLTLTVSILQVRSNRPLKEAQLPLPSKRQDLRV